MKRMLVYVTLIALMITAFPVTGFATSHTYSKDDIMTAVNGMGRMPSNYYTLASIGLEVIQDVTATQAENFTKKLYTMWAFLEKYAYTYNGNASLRDVMSKEQWTAVNAYIGNLAWNYDCPQIRSVLWDFLDSAKVKTLVKTAVPRSLLGIQFDDATVNEPTTVKVYTTAAIKSGVEVTDANGSTIGTTTVVNPYVGTLATFYEHIITIKYPYTGWNGVRIKGLYPNYTDDYYSTSVFASASSTGGSTKKNSAAVLKLTASTATLGSPNTITVTTNATADYAKITDKNGRELAVSNEISGPTETTKTFTFDYCFPNAGKQYIRAYAGINTDSSILWNSTYKTSKVTVSEVASNATISKVTATSQFRGQEATITVFASPYVTQIRLIDENGDVIDLKKTSTTSGRYKVFRLTYTNQIAGSYKVFVQAGNDLDWNSARKPITVKFDPPAVTSISATSALRGTNATIVVSATSNAQTARLLDSSGQEIATATRGGDGKFTFTWRQDTAGKKTVYAQVDDGSVWSAMKSATVTFTDPRIVKVITTRVRRGMESTITVVVSPTVTSVELSDGRKLYIDQKDTREGGNFVFHWSQPTKGTKTIYLRIYDEINWSGYYKSSVTFT